MTARLFPAVLKYWRALRGLSQLQLSLYVGVSTRHLSFLESGRARPSEAMVIALCEALEVPLRARNEVLRAAGFAPHYPEPPFSEIPEAAEQAITRMMSLQEPFPLIVVSAVGDVLRSNRAAGSLFSRFIAEPNALGTPLNMFELVFDPRLMRPFITNWVSVAPRMLARAHREALQRGDDEGIARLQQRVSAFPNVPLTSPAANPVHAIEPAFTIKLQRADVALAFFNTITTFSAPGLVTLEELRIESSYPLDDVTRRYCESVAEL